MATIPCIPAAAIEVSASRAARTCFIRRGSKVPFTVGAARRFDHRSAGLGRTRLFHPWAHEPEGGWSRANVSVSHVVRHRQGSGFDGLGWVPLGPKRARQGPIWSRMGPYINRTPIRYSRVIRRGSSGPVGPYRVPTGFRRNPDLARWDPMGFDGSLDCHISVHN